MSTKPPATKVIAMDAAQVREVLRSKRFLAADRAALDVAEIATWDKYLLREHRLLVPIDLQALYVEPGSSEKMVRLPMLVAHVGGQPVSSTHRQWPPVASSTSDDATRSEHLNRTWRESVPLTHPQAEPARLYLARRGLSATAPQTLRFHPALGYYADRCLVGRHLAILAQVTGQGGDAVTLHRSYLTVDGHKAPVDAPKKLMRHPSARQLTGGAIRLIAPGSRLAVTEGIETALAVIEATGLPAWATGNAHLLETFVPPPGVRQVLVFADKDRPSRQHPSGHGQEAARALVTRLWAMGIQAGAIAPALTIPDGQKGVDWLDVFNLAGKAGFPTLGSVDKALTRAA